MTENISPRPLLGLVADDLTGSMDAAGSFATQGFSTTVVINPATRADISDGQIICVNTQSRLASSQKAADTVLDATRHLVNLGCQRLFKKIDSTMRGNVGPELVAMMQEYKANMAFICPAFPSMGRIVRDGNLLVNDKPLSEATEGNDPFNAISSSSLPEMLEQQTGQRLALVSWRDLEESEASIKSKIDAFLEDSHSIIAFDATTRSHLNTLVSVSNRHFPESLLVGSAGLANQIAAELTLSHMPSFERKNAVIQPNPFILISGSLNQITSSQLERLASTSEIHVIELYGTGILRGNVTLESECERVIELIEKGISSGLDVVMRWNKAQELLEVLTNSDVSSDAANVLVKLVRQVAQGLTGHIEISGLIIVGGETGYTVLDTLEVASVDLVSEIETGIPFGQIAGGILDKKFIVTKAGGFGNEDSLVNVVESIRSLRGF